jgi:hypothetical protein
MALSILSFHSVVLQGFLSKFKSDPMYRNLQVTDLAIVCRCVSESHEPLRNGKGLLDKAKNDIQRAIEMATA